MKSRSNFYPRSATFIAISVLPFFGARSMVKDVTPKDVVKAMTETKLLFVDCWAPWCGPCKALAPILEELDEKYKDDPEIGFLKVNTDNNQDYAREKGIRGIPCVLIFFDGKPAKLQIPIPNSTEVSIVDRLIGLRPIEHYEYVIETLLKRN